MANPDSNGTAPSQGTAGSAVSADFDEARSRLAALIRSYRKGEEELHFEPLERVDTELFSGLANLAQEGVRLVRKHHGHFARHPLYDDGMFWYNLFVASSAAAGRILTDGRLPSIPREHPEALIDSLVSISRYSTVHEGDIWKRNHEALGSMTCAFYDERLIRRLRSAVRSSKTKPMRALLSDSLKSAEEWARKHLPAPAKAAKVGKWAKIMAKWMIRFCSRGKPWKVVAFEGSAGGESRGIVDLIAIRRDHQFAHYPPGEPLKIGDLFEMILIQVKGGGAAAPSPTDVIRLNLVKERYGAKEVVLIEWRRGKVLSLSTLEGGTWRTRDAKEVFA
jgi:hypothetical protein